MPILYWTRPSITITNYIKLSSIPVIIVFCLSLVLTLKFGNEKMFILRDLRTRNVNVAVPNCVELRDGWGSCPADKTLSPVATNIVSYLIVSESSSGKLMYVPYDIRLISAFVLVFNVFLGLHPTIQKTWFYRPGSKARITKKI